MNGFHLKISDFGGARQLSNDLSFAMSENKGTQFYAVPEIHLNKFQSKSVDI
jgi:serine/threonine protein kinase